MKDFLKTIFSAMKTWVGKNIKDSTADWNQNDPSATNYVKNRPFYEKEGIVYKLDKKYLPEEYATLEQVEQAAEAVQAAAEYAQGTAETAQSTAETAQSTANSKMDKTNPTGTGSFSMNGAADGDNSTAFGLGTIAASSCSHVIGEYNKGDVVYEIKSIAYTTSTLLFKKTANFYHAKEYTFNPETGIYTLISPTQISGEALVNSSVSTLLGEWFVTDGSFIGPDKVSGTELAGVIKNYYANQWKQNVSTELSTYNANYYGMSNCCYLSTKHTTSERGQYVHIVGNGTSESERSNAHTLDWDGNAWYQGEVYVGGTSQDDENAERLAKMSDIPSTEGLATESYVNSAVASLVNAAPDTLDTLNELAAALGDDANFATTVTNQISSKLDVSELPTAVNDALAQAKASGEFDGADGTNGKDGTSATHSWSGTSLTITSASGTSSADLKGEKGDTGAAGKDGYSPVRGTDYWTDADKAEIKSYVDEAILGGAW